MQGHRLVLVRPQQDISSIKVVLDTVAVTNKKIISKWNRGERYVGREIATYCNKFFSWRKEGEFLEGYLYLVCAFVCSANMKTKALEVNGRKELSVQKSIYFLLILF